VHVHVYYNLHRYVTTFFVTWLPGGISGSWRYPALCHIWLLQIGTRAPDVRILIPVSSQTLTRSLARILVDFTNPGGATKCAACSDVGLQLRLQLQYKDFESATSDRNKQSRRDYIVIIFSCMTFSAIITATRQSARAEYAISPHIAYWDSARRIGHRSPVMVSADFGTFPSYR